MGGHSEQTSEEYWAVTAKSYELATSSIVPKLKSTHGRLQMQCHNNIIVQRSL